ncbi:MAG: hypothetical protein JSU92_13295 [Deltaproteobacteria bacterium]|nr:MAG: hypothetical protein JSU92_13295 [Deltaproteobacteria bacterium]
MAEKREIEKVGEDVIKIDGRINLKELYGLIGNKGLFVEPLSERQSLSDFILEGGLGFNSLREGSFASRLFWFKSSTGLSQPTAMGKLKEKLGRPSNKYTVIQQTFTYGSEFTTHANAGYPLHRIIEGSPHRIWPQEFGEIAELIIPIRPQEEVNIYYLERGIDAISVPKDARDILFVNEPAAKAIGLEKGGLVVTYPEGITGEGDLVEGVWKNRFIADKVNEGEKGFKFLCMKSGLPKVYELLDKESPGLFFALFTKIGVLVLTSISPDRVEGFWREVSRIPLTYRISK